MKKLMLIGLLSGLSLFAFDGRAEDGTVVPEPATIGLMGVGVVAIGLASWRKNRKK